VQVELEDLRLAVYEAFAETARAPTFHDLAGTLASSAQEVSEGLAQLQDARHLALDPSGQRIVMAHPFSAGPLGFSVMGTTALWWGGCAWDAFAMPHLLPHEPEVLVATTCPACASAHAWLVDTTAPPVGDEVAHFLVPADRMWDDIIHTCGHQRLFCNERCVNVWLDSTGNDKGYVMDVTTLWRLAAHWYDGRLDRGYERREPSAAKDYFTEVGLTGPFWGL
jgi:hypothetical protein